MSFTMEQMMKLQLSRKIQLLSNMDETTEKQ